MSAPEPAPGGSRGSSRALRRLALGAFAGLAVAAYALLDTGPRRALPGDAAAVVGGETISREAYERALAALGAGRREALTADQRRHVLERLIEEELLIQRGLELGLARHDPRVRGDLVAAVIELVRAQADAEPPDDDEVRAFYEAQRGRLARGGRFRVETLWVRAEPERSEAEARRRAERAAQRLRAGEGFAEVSAELGDEPIAPLPEAPLPAASLREYRGPAVAQAAGELELGEVSAPLPSAGGYTLLRVIERVPGTTPAFREIEAEVRARLLREREERALRAYLEELRGDAEIRVGSP